jgi:MFS family permease
MNGSTSRGIAMMHVLRWSVIGALIGPPAAAILMFAGFFIANHHEMLTHDSNEVQAWTWFIAYVLTGCAAVVGLVLGAIGGAVRGYIQLRKERRRDVAVQ